MRTIPLIVAMLLLLTPAPVQADVGILPSLPPSPPVEVTPPTITEEEILDLTRVGTGGWYLVTTQITGVSVTTRPDGTIHIGATTGQIGSSGSVRVPVARVIAEVRDVAQVVHLDGQLFTYPRAPNAFLTRNLNPAYLDLSAVPPASPSPSGMDRQPAFTNGPETRGSLTRGPRINLLERLRAQGRLLTPEQEEWIRALDGKAVPGTLRVTILLSPGGAGGKWRVSGWVYNFEPDLTLVLQQMPPAESVPDSGSAPQAQQPSVAVAEANCQVIRAGLNAHGSTWRVGDEVPVSWWVIRGSGGPAGPVSVNVTITAAGEVLHRETVSLAAGKGKSGAVYPLARAEGTLTAEIRADMAGTSCAARDSVRVVPPPPEPKEWSKPDTGIRLWGWR